MKYKENMEETKERFEAWWNRSCIGRPLMKIVAKREKLLEQLEPENPFKTDKDIYLDVVENTKRFRNFNRKYEMMADAFPHLSINIGPGSLVVYLGSEPVFSKETVWYTDMAKNGWDKIGPLKYDPENKWWRCHLDAIKKAVELSLDDFLVDIPDLVENVDILSAMRGPMNFCYDLMDIPHVINDYVNQLDNLYFKFYDPLYDLVKLSDGSSSYTAFDVLGAGKTAKIQCDFCAMMSPDHFLEFVQPSLRNQCRQLNHSIYHLDGPDAIKHVDALMNIKELDALQWTPGSGNPDGGHEKWYPVYDKVRRADKSLWIYICDGKLKDQVESADRLVKRYGPDGLYFLFPGMEMSDALQLIKKAEKDWK